MKQKCSLESQAVLVLFILFFFIWFTISALAVVSGIMPHNKHQFPLGNDGRPNFGEVQTHAVILTTHIQYHQVS